MVQKGHAAFIYLGKHVFCPCESVRCLLNGYQLRPYQIWRNKMKKVIMSAVLLASTLALAACTTANTADVKSAEPVFEKKVTK